jgi:hypothetical protein
MAAEQLANSFILSVFEQDLFQAPQIGYRNCCRRPAALPGMGAFFSMAKDPKDLEDHSGERMIQRFRQGLLTKEELDGFLELQRQRAETLERALQAGRRPAAVKRVE